MPLFVKLNNQKISISPDSFLLHPPSSSAPTDNIKKCWSGQNRFTLRRFANER